MSEQLELFDDKVESVTATVSKKEWEMLKDLKEVATLGDLIMMKEFIEEEIEQIFYQAVNDDFYVFKGYKRNLNGLIEAHFDTPYFPFKEDAKKSENLIYTLHSNTDSTQILKEVLGLW